MKKYYYRLRKKIREWRRTAKRDLLHRVGRGGPNVQLEIQDVRSVVTGGFVQNKED